MALITKTVIEDAVRAWIMTAVPALSDAIPSNDGGPRPAVPYATFLVSPPRAIGQDDRGTLTDPGAPAYASRAMRGDRLCSVSVQFFGGDAVDNIRTALNDLNKESPRGTLWTVGLAPATAGDPQDLTELLETSFEARAQADVVFALADEYIDTVPLIEHVTGTGTVTPGPVSVPFEAHKT